MRRFFGHLRAHPHIAVSGAIGFAAAVGASGVHSVVGRCLLGWNVGAWLYLVWTGWSMLHSDSRHLERVAKAQAESASTVLLVVALAAIASFGAITVELAAAKAAGPRFALSHALITLSTVFGSWLLVPTLFSLNYASLYDATTLDGDGLKFPDEGADFEPEYSDFLYFSFTIAVASQTSDVLITNRKVRRLVLLQSVLSFVFNTTILAFTINIAASLF